MRERGKTHQNDFLKMGEVISAKLKFSELKFLEDNPRTITRQDLERLAGRIKEDPTFFDNRPCLVNFIDGEYVCYAGFQRAHAAAKVLKWKEVPCMIENDVPTDVMRKRAILDNTHDGKWDADVLSSWEFEMDELRDMGVPEFVFGISDEEDSKSVKVKGDDYEIPDEIKTDIVLGDLLKIGNHKLLCGDSTDSDNIDKIMGSDKADLVFTDPDFSMSFDLLKSVYSNAVIFSKGIGFWVCGDKQSVQIAMNDFENFAKFFVQDFRQATLVSNNQPMTRHVMIVQMGRKAMNNLHDGFSTLLQIATDRTSEVHKTTPMSKKVELPAEFISHYSNEGDIVLDFFGHSGSTMVAAHQLNRRCNMIEIEPKYCQCIIERMIKLDPLLKVTRNGQEYENKFDN